MLLILRNMRIVSNIPQKQHTIPADVLPNDSEDLFQVSPADPLHWRESQASSVHK